MAVVDELMRGRDPVARRPTAGYTLGSHRSWAALMAGALVLGVAAVATVEVVAALAGVPLRLSLAATADYAVRTHWNDPSVRISSAVLAGIGLVLTMPALVPSLRFWTVPRAESGDRGTGPSIAKRGGLSARSRCRRGCRAPFRRPWIGGRRRR